jgi:hypothetical protein
VATKLYYRNSQPALWGVSTRVFSTKDASRGVTPGSELAEGSTLLQRLFDTVGTGVGSTTTRNSVAGPTSGILATNASGNTDTAISDPIAADITISGTVSFDMCGLESAMAANATFRMAVYRVDPQGALTLIVNSSAVTELGTSTTRLSWSASPTSTDLFIGDRIWLVPMFDDAAALTMASGNTLEWRDNGANASTADSAITFTENLTFITSDPAGSTHYLRDTASDVSGLKVLSLTQGSGTSEAVHTTIAGPITFPGDQWTATAGGADIGWITPSLDAFTLSGGVKAVLTNNNTALEDPLASPFDAITIELAICDSDGSNATVWARSYTSTVDVTGDKVYYLTGPSTSVAQGKRLRLIVYSDDFRPKGNQVAGTDRTIRYDGTSTYASRLIFTQTITEETAGPVTVTPGVGSLTLTGFAPAVVIGTIIATGLGALTLTGLAPSVVVGTIAAPAAGSLSLTGFAPTVTATNNVTLTPGTGTLTVTGFAPTVAATDHQTVTPSTGSLTLTGFAPTATVNTILSPDVGALTLTGFSPTVTASDHQTASPGLGSLTLTGFAPTVTATDHQAVTPGVGSLALTGFAPSLDLAITPATGTLTLTGFAPTIIAGVSAEPGVGSLTLTGFAPTVSTTAHVTASPAAGSLTLTAFAPTVTASDHQTVTPAAGSLTLTGFAPTVGGGTTVEPTTGALSLTGFAPTVTATAHVTVTPGVGSLTLSGFAPSLDLTITAAAGALALTGFAPTVLAGVSAEPGVGALTLTGFPPTVSATNHQTVTPAVGQLILTGFAPSVEAADHQTVTPAAGALTLTGFAPVVAIDLSVTPGVGQLTLTGFAPDIIAPCLVTPPTGQMILTGFAPTATEETGFAVDRITIASTTGVQITIASATGVVLTPIT